MKNILGKILILGIMLTVGASFSNAAAPSVLLKVVDNTLSPGDSAQLFWNGSNILSGNSCVAGGGMAGDGWTGPMPAPYAEFDTLPLEAGTYTYTIVCTGSDNQTATSSAIVYVQQVGLPNETLTITATPASVLYNHSTTLNWSGTNVTTPCTPTGYSGGSYLEDWTNPPTGSPRQASGTFHTTNLTTPPEAFYWSYNFTLTCTGMTSGAPVSATVTVPVADEGLETNANFQTNHPTTPTNQLPYNNNGVNLTFTATVVPPNGTCTKLEGPVSPGTGNAWAGPMTAWGVGAYSDVFSTGPLSQTTTYRVSCNVFGSSGMMLATITVHVAPAPIVDVGVCTLPTNTPGSLRACTGEATHVEDKSAYLNGGAGAVLGKDAYAYFRYTKVKLPIDNPSLFCNDLYGSNMIATEEEYINPWWQTPVFADNFDIPIQNLTPDTQYKYCAVVSNHPTKPTQIKYGEIKTFRTKPCTEGPECKQAGVETKQATHITDTSAQINGNYRTMPAADTYFKYSIYPIEYFVDLNGGQGDVIGGNFTTSWQDVAGNIDHPGEIADHRNAKSYGSMNFVLENLEPNQTYVYKAFLKTHESTTPPSLFNQDGQTIASQTFEGEQMFFTTTLPDDFEPPEGEDCVETETTTCPDTGDTWEWVDEVEPPWVYNDFTICPELTINQINNQNIPAGQTLTFTATVCGDLPLSWPAFYSFDLPEGAILDGSTGIFTWTPTTNQVGEYEITIRANDSFGNVAEPVIVPIVVEAPFDGDNCTVGDCPPPPPDCTGNNCPPPPDPCPQLVINPISDQDVYAESTMSFAVNTHCYGPLNQVTYWATWANGAPQGALFNNATGVFTWTPTEAQIGEYDMTIHANEWLNIADPVTVHITVEAPFSDQDGDGNDDGDGDDNGNNNQNSPDCIPFQILSLQNQEIEEGSTISFAVNTCGEQPQGIHVNYSMTGLSPQSGALLGHGNLDNGVFTWTPTDAHIGEHHVIFNANHVGNSNPLGNQNITTAEPRKITITVKKKTTGSGGGGDGGDGDNTENFSCIGSWDGGDITLDGGVGGTSTGNGPWTVHCEDGNSLSGNGPWSGTDTEHSEDIGDGNRNSGNGRWNARIPRRNATNNGLLVLGQTATPPNDAIVRYHEGIEHALQRQIVKNKILATRYGYTETQDLVKFSWSTADFFARIFGYVDQNGKEIRVVQPDIAAYEIQLRGNKLTVYEYYDNKIVNIQQLTDALRSSYDFEYYFQKR